MSFKPGDLVVFAGLKEEFLKLNIPSAEGELLLVDSNTSQKGVMRIKGDPNGMLFLPDGTIYCHRKYGVLLSAKIAAPAKDVTVVTVEVLNAPAIETKGEKP
jgi:hypothetical protein